MASDTLSVPGKFFGAALCVAARSCATPTKSKAPRREHVNTRRIFMASPPVWLGHLLQRILLRDRLQSRAQARWAADRGNAAVSGLPFPRRAWLGQPRRPALARFPRRRRR